MTDHQPSWEARFPPDFTPSPEHAGHVGRAVVGSQFARQIHDLTARSSCAVHEVVLACHLALIAKYAAQTEVTGAVTIATETEGDADLGGPGYDDVHWGTARIDAASTLRDVVAQLRRTANVAIYLDPETVVSPSIVGHGEALRVVLNCPTGQYLAETTHHLAMQHANVLLGLAREPEAPLWKFVAISEDDLRCQDEANQTFREAPDPGTVIHDLVDQWANRLPDQLAVNSSTGTLTYRQLCDAADALARSLQARRVGRETPVAVCLTPGPQLIVALLAVLKAGGAYVPVDPKHPAVRTAAVMSDSRATLAICEPATVDAVASLSQENILVLDALDARAPAPRLAQRTGRRDTDLAYIVYTSGSTGLPKGVEVEHRSVVNFLQFVREELAVGPNDVVALEARSTFDIFVFECWGALSSGATLAIIHHENILAPDGLKSALDSFSVTVLRLPANLLVRHLRERPGLLRGLRLVCYGGEVSDRATMERLAMGSDAPDRLVHWYGPTETTVISTTQSVDARLAPGSTMPIGRPICNTRVYVVDETGCRVPTGVPGELWIGGRGVARGYRGAPEMTQDRFLLDPFLPDALVDGRPARVYRTGDTVRWRTNGSLEFLGRSDGQVKVRGIRVELSEIEAVVLSSPQVVECAAAVRPDPSGYDRLEVFCVPGPDGVDEESIREICEARLPEELIPIVRIFEYLPRTTTGKIDRSRLQAPLPAQQIVRDVDSAGRDRVESVVAGLWRETLGIADSPPDVNFFASGGHSLLAVRFVHRVNAALGTRLRLKDFIADPTLRATVTAVRSSA